MSTTTTTTKTLICTCSSLEEAESIIDSLIHQTKLFRDHHKKVVALHATLSKALATINVKYIEPPAWIYALSVDPPNFHIWRIESCLKD